MKAKLTTDYLRGRTEQADQVRGLRARVAELEHALTAAQSERGTVEELMSQTLAAVPALRPLSPRRRAVRAARSLRLLALWALPLLLLTWPLLQWADTAWWDGRWQLALALLPGLVVRMAAGLPLAVLGPWLAVALPPWAAARVHTRWTAAELLLAGAALAWLGPAGLAVSWALGGALGTLLFMNALRPHGLGWFLGALKRLPNTGRQRWSMSTCS